MTKIYRYENISIDAKVKSNTLEVKFISNGNYGPTLANVPGSLDPVISNSGTCELGPKSSLGSAVSVMISDIVNPIPEETRIELKYYINGKIIVHHLSEKSEAERAMIVIIIQFT